ncbi:hypothetical protein D2E26_0545 [Bifidobacterium dolichotidis]|uniref:BspA family leucine-rich repeat surface protein n=1 Tax=Bifidobacterium dolichotidis TaxID=2306976 RepID=A0A430FSY3_9BIFI|nr:leucine-rich repeat protein [Bifidobacterium dolichotidis]RSX55982.1 hypothetical protein D2E26_0545 [Bifidobacterium dolichotidis]
MQIQSHVAQKGIGITLSALLAVTSFVGVPAYAQTAVAQDEPGHILSAGRWGTCDWSFDEDSGAMSIATTGACKVDPDKGNFLNGDADEIATRHAIKTAEIKNTITVLYGTEFENMFKGASAFTELKGMGNFDFSQTGSGLSIAGMFSGTNFKKADFNNLKIENNQISMAHLLDGAVCDEIDTSQIPFDKHVNSVAGMFANMRYLTSITLPEVQAEDLMNTSHMFESDYALTSVDWNIEAKDISDIAAMFADCPQLKSVDLSKMHAQAISESSFVFGSCPNLKEINLGDMQFNQLQQPALASSMFYQTGVKKITLTRSAITRFNDLYDPQELFTGTFPGTPMTKWRGENPNTKTEEERLWLHWGNQADFPDAGHIFTLTVVD